MLSNGEKVVSLQSSVFSSNSPALTPMECKVMRVFGVRIRHVVFG